MIAEKYAPKTVIFVSHSFNLTGAESSLLDVVINLDRRRWAPVVVTPFKGPLIEILKREHIPFFSFPYMWWITRPSQPLLRSRFTAAIAHLILNYLAAAIIAQRFRRANVRLVYSNTIACPVGALVAKRLGTPHLWHVREFVQEDIGAEYALGTRRAMDFVRRSSNLVVCNSRAVCEKMAQYLPETTLKVIYNGVLDKIVGDFPERRPPSGNEFELSIVGTVFPGKGQEDAIQAVDNLAKRGITAVLHVVGTGTRDYREYLQALARRKGIEQSIRFEGYSTEPLKFFANSDVALVCSRFEAFGRVAVEAMAMGTPVVAAEAGGITEVIKDGETGLLYPPGDSGALADRIALLLASPDLWKHLSKKGRDSVYTRFTRERYVKEMTAVISGLVGDESDSNTKAKAPTPSDSFDKV